MGINGLKKYSVIVLLRLYTEGETEFLFSHNFGISRWDNLVNSMKGQLNWKASKLSQNTQKQLSKVCKINI